MKLKHRIAVSYLRTNLKLLSIISKKRAAKKALRLFCTPFNKSRRTDSPLFDQAEKLTFRLDNKLVTGYRWNHPQERKFLIVHGFQSSARKFEKYVSPMIAKGYEVLAFDAPAHGDSEGRQINVLEYKNLIKELVNRYGPIESFIAHSFGGLALSLALEEISHTNDTRVALIAPATETSSAVDLLFSYLKLPNNLRKEFDDLIFATGGVKSEWLSITRAISNIRASILWIHDEDDDITPLKDVQPLITAAHQNIKFMITKGWGHRRIYHEKEVINAIVEFLTSDQGPTIQLTGEKSEYGLAVNV